VNLTDRTHGRRGGALCGTHAMSIQILEAGAFARKQSSGQWKWVDANMHHQVGHRIYVSILCLPRPSTKNLLCIFVLQVIKA